jgi:RHS repeat-associated protein
VQVTYTNEPQQYGGVISQRRGTTTSTYHADALGSTRALTDNSGNVTDTYLNDAWGNSVASAGTTVNPFKWVGKYGYYTDNSTAQVYVRARMYQPTVARWLSVDPIGVINGDNLYLYVQRFIDPSGWQCQAPDGVTYRPRGYFRESLIEPRGIGVGWPEKLFDWVDQTSIRHGARGNLCFEKSDFSYRMDVAVAMKLPSCRLFAIGIKQRIPFWRFCAGTIGIWIAKVAHTYIHFKGMVYLVMILSNRNHIRRGCKTFLGLG